MEKTIRYCKECGKELKKYSTMDFCTQTCKSFYNGTRVRYNCDNCGKESSDKKSHYIKKKNHYCCDECKNAHQGTIYVGENNPNYNRTEFNCDYCGTVLYLPNHLKNNAKHFCNKECNKKYNKEYCRISCTCDYCGKKYDLPKNSYERSKHHYCSVDCKDKDHGKLVSGELNVKYSKKEYVCEICGKTTLKKPHELKRNKHIYCSDECRWIGWGKFFSGENNPKWKDDAVFECDYCGKTSSMRKGQYDKFKKHYCSKECQVTDYKNPLRPVINYLRSNAIWDWYRWSERQCENKCVVTGSKQFVVHHLYKFEYIVKEVFDILGYEIKETIGEYSEPQIKNISKVCLELHYKYGPGVCLSKDIHKKLHKSIRNGGIGNGRECNKDNFIKWIKINYNIEMNDFEKVALP